MDLRNEWERTDSHHIMKEQEVSLLQMTWRNLAMQAKGEERRKESMRAQDEKRQRMGTGGHCISGTRKKFPWKHHHHNIFPDQLTPTPGTSHRHSAMLSPEHPALREEEDAPNTPSPTEANDNILMEDAEGGSPGGTLSIKGAAKNKGKGKGHVD